MWNIGPSSFVLLRVCGQWYMSFETWYLCDRYFHLMDINFSVTSLNVVVWCTLFVFFNVFSTVLEPLLFQLRTFSLFNLRIMDKICIHSDKIMYRGFTCFTFSVNTSPAQKTIWWNWALTIISEKLCDGSKHWPTWFLFFCHHCIEYKLGVET